MSGSRRVRPRRRRDPLVIHLRAAATHDQAAELHEAAANLHEEHAVEMREAGSEERALRAERLADHERQLASDQLHGMDEERRRAAERLDASRPRAE